MPIVATLVLIIFAITYLGLALGRLPGLRADRAAISLAGASAMLACGAIDFPTAVRAVDFATLGLLLGMMILVGFLREAGFFDRLQALLGPRRLRPRALLALVMLASAVLSALLVNDVVCLALTPLVLRICRTQAIHPVPQLIGLAVASNVGSAATLTGNPQNMIIGELSGIPYCRFAGALAPVAALGLAIAYAVIALLFRASLRPSAAPTTGAAADRRFGRRVYRRLLLRGVLVTLATVLAFFLNVPLAVAALCGASAMLLGRVHPRRIYAQVDWGLLVMFAGLFVVVRACELHFLQRLDVQQWPWLTQHPVPGLSLLSAALSNLVSNVPAVLLFKPVVPQLAESLQETAWLTLAMSSTLAGNLTVLASVANLIVVEAARKEGVQITLGDYCKAGVPITALTLLAGVWWLA